MILILILKSLVNTGAGVFNWAQTHTWQTMGQKP